MEYKDWTKFAGDSQLKHIKNLYDGKLCVYGLVCPKDEKKAIEKESELILKYSSSLLNYGIRKYK